MGRIKDLYNSLNVTEKQEALAEICEIARKAHIQAMVDQMKADQLALVGRKCFYCRKEILAGESAKRDRACRPIHQECEWESRERYYNSPG